MRIRITTLNKISVSVDQKCFESKYSNLCFGNKIRDLRKFEVKFSYTVVEFEILYKKDISTLSWINAEYSQQNFAITKKKGKILLYPFFSFHSEYFKIPHDIVSFMSRSVLSFPISSTCLPLFNSPKNLLTCNIGTTVCIKNFEKVSMFKAHFLFFGELKH